MIYPFGSTVIIENTTNYTQHFLHGHTNDVSCVAVCKSGKYIASGQITSKGNKADVIVWDYKHKSLYAKLTLHKDKVVSLAFSPNDLFLVTLGGQDGVSVVMWDLKEKVAICGSMAQPKNAGNTNCVAFHQTNDYIFVTRGDGTLRVWDLQVENKKILPKDTQLGQIRRSVKSLHMTDQYLLCGTITGDILGIDMTKNVLQFYGSGTKDKYFSYGVTALALVKNDELLVGSGSGEVALLKVCKKNEDVTFEKKHSWRDQNPKGVGAVTSIAPRGDGDQFYVGTANSQVYRFIYEKFTCELVKSCDSTGVKDVVFPFGDSDLMITAQEEQIRIWHTKSRKELERKVVSNMVCNALNITRDGKIIVSAWSDGNIRGYDFKNNKLTNTFEENVAHKHGVTAVAITLDCRYIISGGDEGEVRIWSIKDGHINDDKFLDLERTMKEHKGLVSDIKITYDGTKCVSSSTDGTTIIWNLETRKRQNIVFAKTVFKCVIYGQEEHHVVTSGTDREIVYWDTSTGKQIREVEGSKSGSINAIDITADGKYLVTGGDEKILKLWTYKEAKTVAVGLGHNGAINKVRISPNQKNIVSVSQDGEILIWKFPSSVS